jgi:hypothetical protein
MHPESDINPILGSGDENGDEGDEDIEGGMVRPDGNPNNPPGPVFDNDLKKDVAFDECTSNKDFHLRNQWCKNKFVSGDKAAINNCE